MKKITLPPEHEISNLEIRYHFAEIYYLFSPTGFVLCLFILIYQSARATFNELLISGGLFNLTSLGFGMLEEGRRGGET